jgi:hypothetical protein
MGEIYILMDHFSKMKEGEIVLLAKRKVGTVAA